MTTTSIFVELVVIGLHALGAIGLAIFALVGNRRFDVERVLTLNLAVPILAIAYVLGILIDRLSDVAFAPLDLQLRKRHQSSTLPTFLTMRYFILNKSGGMHEQLEYIRSRLRIMRASVINFILTTIAAVFLIVFRWDEQAIPISQVSAGVIALVAGLLLTVLCRRACVMLIETYNACMVTAFRVLHDGVAVTAPENPDTVNSKEI